MEQPFDVMRRKLETRGPISREDFTECANCGMPLSACMCAHICPEQTAIEIAEMVVERYYPRRDQMKMAMDISRLDVLLIQALDQSFEC